MTFQCTQHGSRIPATSIVHWQVFKKAPAKHRQQHKFQPSPRKENCIAGDCIVAENQLLKKRFSIVMRVIFFLTTFSLSVMLAGCSAEASFAPAVQVERNVINPSIPAVTISAWRMTDVEKLAYDQSLAVKVAVLPASK